MYTYFSKVAAPSRTAIRYNNGSLIVKANCTFLLNRESCKSRFQRVLTRIERWKGLILLIIEWWIAWKLKHWRRRHATQQCSTVATSTENHFYLVHVVTNEYECPSNDTGENMNDCWSVHRDIRHLTTGEWKFKDHRT